jgi:hypothetical protein
MRASVAKIGLANGSRGDDPVVNAPAPGYRPVHEPRAPDRKGTTVTPGRRLLLCVPAAVLAAATLLPAGWESPVPLCVVKGITGLDCPGCGMTRAFLFIGHGHFAAAAAMHPASIPAYLIVAGLALAGIVRIVRNRPT